jgi:hypothetical protein
VKITSIFDNFMIFGVDSTHNKLRDQLTSAQRNIVGTNIKKHLFCNLQSRGVNPRHISLYELLSNPTT